jgi:PPE-repeat protein
MTAPVWMASPPEVHSVLLSSGPGPGSLLAAAGAWTSLSSEYASAASELTSLLGAVQAGAWEGPSAEVYVSAHVPYLAWLTEASADSAAAAAQHEVAAAAYTVALAAMPTIPELAANHVIHGVLIATNFFGLNTIPIALNETDYARMWIQAATTMATYQGVSGSALASSPRTAAAPPVLKTNSAATAAADPSASGNFLTDIYNQLVQLIQDPSGTISSIIANPSTYFPLLFFIAYEVATSIAAAITYPSLTAAAILAVVLPAALQQLLANPAAVAPTLTAPAGGAVTPESVRPVVVPPPAPASSAAAPAPTSAAGTAAAAGGSAAAPATAGFGYMVGGIDPDGGPGPTLIDRDATKAPASAIPVAAAVAAVSRDKTRARRRRRAEMHDHADEFADMNVEVDPDWSTQADREPVASTVASDRGGGPLGFAGTVDKDTVAAAAGLATLSSNGFGQGPTMPMVPGTWGPEPTDGKGDHN